MSSRGKATAKGSAGWPSTSRRPLSPPREESSEREEQERMCGGHPVTGRSDSVVDDCCCCKDSFPLSSPVTLASCHTLSLPTLPCPMEKQQGRRPRFFPIGSIPDVSLNPYLNTHTSCIKSAVQTGERRRQTNLALLPAYFVFFLLLFLFSVLNCCAWGRRRAYKTF